MKKGNKVVCIYTFGKNRKDVMYGVRHPVKDAIYTIREVIKGKYIRLEELRNPILPYSMGREIMECMYLINKFVPLQEKFEKITYSKVTELIEIGQN